MNQCHPANPSAIGEWVSVIEMGIMEHGHELLTGVFIFLVFLAVLIPFFYRKSLD